MSRWGNIIQKITKKPVVIDNGTFCSRIGFAGDNYPCSIFPTIICYLQEKTKIETRVDYLIGKEVLNFSKRFKIVHPLEWRFINNWEALIKIWEYSFYSELRIDPKEHPILITKSPRLLIKQEEKVSEIMFEKFNIPALYLANQASLALFASNRITGVVIDAGHELIFCVPFYEGFPLYAAQIQYLPAGKDITELLNSMLQENDNDIPIEFRNEIVQDIKEKKCYVALDIEKESIRAEKSTFGFKYTLPNKEILRLGRELFFAPECLFDPSLLNQPYPPLPKVINDSIQACDPDIQNSLYQNIIICGGTSMFPGFKERLTLELQKLTPDKNIINIVAPEQRENYTWLGGSLFASEAYVLDQWVSKEDYFKHGPSIIHRCL